MTHPTKSAGRARARKYGLELSPLVHKRRRWAAVYRKLPQPKKRPGVLDGGGPSTCICLPDSGNLGLPEGTLLVVHDGEWMALEPGPTGTVLAVGDGGTLEWVEP